MSETHFQRLSRWLQLEAAAEDAQTQQTLLDMPPELAEQSGHSLVGLVPEDLAAGLGGRALVTLSKRNEQQSLPWTRLNIGSPVLLSRQTSPGENDDTRPWRGVISARDRRTVQVALNQWPEFEDERALFRIDLSGDEVARLRQQSALDQAAAARDGRLAHLRQILLGELEPRFGPLDSAFTAFNPDLNPAQHEAIALALAAEDLAIIHGPPGTGKTTTVVELIRQAVQRGDRILACAPSNLAVDNMFERLLAAGESVLRLGHPARVLPTLRDHTLDVMVEQHPDVRLARKLMRDAHALRSKAGRYGRTGLDRQTRREMQREARAMLHDARRLESQTVQRLLAQAQIICATTTGLDEQLLGDMTFDLAVVDEAGQSTEPGMWLPVLRTQRLVLAGDHCQLPPTILSQQAAAEGFGVSLMERLQNDFSGRISRRLVRQYRMHRQIMAFSSAEFYDNSLEADDRVAAALLTDEPSVQPDELTCCPIHFIDTAGAGFDEELEPDGKSRRNVHEARLVCELVAELQTLGLAAADIAVITPYSAQVRYLREALADESLEIGSVDGFQGREKKVVIISLVRSNPEGDIGFLGELRRMNVALTRAQRKLLVIGDSATITYEPFYQRLVAYFEEVGAYHSVWERL